jgi:hypothetical protein
VKAVLPAAALAALLAAAAAAPQTARGAGAAVKVVFIGDSGTGDSHQRAVRDQMVRVGPSWVFMLGDNIYS